MKSTSWISVILTILLITSALTTITVHPLKGVAADSQETEEGLAINNAATNLTEWNVIGKGKIEDTEQGILLASEPNENVMAIANVISEDFIYEADVKILDKNADLSLVFRSSEDGKDAYMLQINPIEGKILLRDSRDETRLNDEHNVTVHEGEIYHLKVKVEENTIFVYWENQYSPIMSVTDSAYEKGLLGLHVSDGSALFQHVKVSEFSTNLSTSQYKEGSWEPALKGLKGISIGDGGAKQIYRNSERDFVLEGNITFDENQSEAALAFRTNEQGTTGYLATLIKEGNTVKAQLQKVDGTVLKTSDKTYKTEEGTKHHLEIMANGEQIELYVDGFSEAAMKVTDKSELTGFVGMTVAEGSAYFQDVYLIPLSKYYNEKYRPDYHYTPARGSVSDPNGLVYFEGEYHLFHQDGGTWAHAVSKDLVN